MTENAAMIIEILDSPKINLNVKETLRLLIKFQTDRSGTQFNQAQLKWFKKLLS